MRVRLKHIKAYKRKLAGGTIEIYRYHRLTGKRISGEPGTPEFLASYELASQTDVDASDSTFGGLIARYKASAEFGKLAPRTRQDYDKHLQALDIDWGTIPLAAFEDRRVRSKIKNRRDQLAKFSARQADYQITVLSIALGYGADSGLLTDNHASGIAKLYKANRADKIWLPEHVAAFQAAASPEIGLGFMLALHTAQRQADLLALTWSGYDGSSITLRQSKTGVRVRIPCTVALKSLLDATQRQAVPILTNSRGHAWTQDGFRSSFRKTQARAGIEGLTFHDLRGTAVTMLAEAGCTEAEISAISGHTMRGVSQIIDKYLSRTRALAESAIVKLERRNRLATKLSNRVSNGAGGSS